MSRPLATALALTALATAGAHAAVAAPTPAPDPLIVLPNLDDDSRRCPAATEDAKFLLRDARGRRIARTAVTRCNDAADDRSNGSADMLDITPVRVGAQARVAAGARVNVRVIGGPKGVFRVMVRRGAEYVGVDRSPLTGADLRRPVTLGVEGTDIRRGGWDGRATLRVTAPGMRAVDVPIVLAPIIYQHDLTPVRTLITAGTVAGTSATNPEQSRGARRFAREAAAAAAPIGARTTSLPSPVGDVYVQDAFEPTLATRPLPGGRVQSIRLLVRRTDLVRPNAPAALGGISLELFNRLRGPGVGVVSTPVSRGAGAAQRLGDNAGGNWSVVPPYRTATASYPLGRIIYGGRPDARLRAIAQAQGLQAPFSVDVGWAGVGHLDEMITFLPARNARGWIVGIADPQAGLALVRDAVSRGQGDGTVLTGITRSDGGGPAVSVAERLTDLLADPDVLKGTADAQRVIDSQVDVLRRELELRDDEIVRLPILVRSPAGSGGGVTVIPSVVNSQYLGDGVLLSPHQHGPVVGGRDVFEAEVERLLTPHGLKIRWIEDYHHAHAGGGEVHCTTNVFRAVPPQVLRWWTAPGALR